MNIHNIINDFPPDKYNLLSPVQSIQELNPIFKYVQNIVKISLNLIDKEIYEEKSAGVKMYALTHKGLMKLSNAANGQILESRKIQPRVCEKCIDIAKATGQAPKCVSCEARYNTAYRATMKFPELSGGWKLVQATREVDTSAIAMTAQANKLKEFAGEHAESKAMSRCIRKALNIKNAYSVEELKKPFVVVYPVLDAKDPDVKKALIAGSMASSNLLYGSGMQMQLQAPEAIQALAEYNPTENIVVSEDYEVERFEGDNEIINKDDIHNVASEEERYFCSNNSCGVEIQANVASYSEEKLGRPLCFKCQQIEKWKGDAK